MDEAEVAATEQAVADFEIGVKERLVVEAVRPFPDQVGAKKQRRRASEDVDLVEKRRAADLRTRKELPIRLQTRTGQHLTERHPGAHDARRRVSRGDQIGRASSRERVSQDG